MWARSSVRQLERDHPELWAALSRSQFASAPEKVKSPLRCPGGKTRAVAKIRAYIPKGLSTLVSPFVGGGSVEIDQAVRGVRVKAYDAFEPLVCFWEHLLNDPVALHSEVLPYLPLTKDKFTLLQRTNPAMAWGIEQAATFYVLNRSSFSGLTLSGGMSPGHGRFNHSNAETVRTFRAPALTVECLDFRESIAANPDDFMYLDPPYLLDGAANKLYGVNGSAHKNFAHADLFDLLKDRDNWIMSYNDASDIAEMYRGFPTARPKWVYGMSTVKASKELLIGSRNIRAHFEETANESVSSFHTSAAA